MKSFVSYLSGCDLLSFYYLCRTGNNVNGLFKYRVPVVICFHFTIFVVLETTGQRYAAPARSLWFAFILLSLSYWKQLTVLGQAHRPVVICFHFTIFVVLETTQHCRISSVPRCDLLSFYYLCRTGNNRAVWRNVLGRVVICFHFTIFVVLETTPHFWCWFPRGCDLLSFYYLCRTGNNFAWILSRNRNVVICFHFTIFVVLETTSGFQKKTKKPLWFAFILLSLSYWKQHSDTTSLSLRCCDLLSFYYLCRTGNNHSVKN